MACFTQLPDKVLVSLSLLFFFSFFFLSVFSHNFQEHLHSPHLLKAKVKPSERCCGTPLVSDIGHSALRQSNKAVYKGTTTN